MQHHHPYKITPDQAWDKMRLILDDKMPENPPSRKYPIVWWSVSALAIAAVMGILVFNEKPAVQKIQQTPAHQEIAPASTESQLNDSKTIQSNTSETKPASGSSSSVQNELNSVIKSIPPAGSNKKETKFSKPVISTAKKADPAPAPVNTVPMAMNSAEETVEPAAQPVIIAENTTPEVFLQDQIFEEEFSTGLVEVYEERYRDTRVTEPIENDNSITGIPYQHNDPIVTGKALKNKIKTPFIEPNIAASGMAGINGGLGLYGGVGANLNVSKRFSITTSLGYLTYSPNAILSDYLEALDGNAEYNTIVNYDPAIIGNETYVDAGNVNNHAGYNAINPLVDRISQWHVSTGVKWKVSPRFFTELGVQFGLHTQAYSEYPIVQFDYSNNPKPSLRINNSLDEYDVIRSSTTSLYMGVGYRIGQHFDVFSNWNHGLHQYILNDENSAAAESSSEERTDYIRGLSLGLRYTL